jgi:hypothetical protein
MGIRLTTVCKIKPIVYNSPGILTENKERLATLLKIAHAAFLLTNGELKLKNAPGFKEHPIFFIALLLACTVFFVSCGGDSSSNSSSASPAPITPIGAQATCLTLHPPALVKLADGHYKLVDEIDNCSGKDIGPFTVTAQIDTVTTKLSTNLTGPATIAANGNAMYHTFTGQTGDANKEIQFPAPSSPSAVVTVLVTMNGAVQGEWDGQVTIPA